MGRSLTKKRQAFNQRLVIDQIGVPGLYCTHHRTRSDERNVVVLPDALKQEEGRRAVTVIDDEVWATWWDRIGISGRKVHLLFGFAQEEPDMSSDDIERILNIAVEMPGDLLSWGDLEFIDAEARPFSVPNASLDFIKLARIFDWFLVSSISEDLPKLNCDHFPSIIRTIASLD